MLVQFEMITDEMNINFKVFGKRDGNIVTFPDKSVPNTIITLEFWDTEIEIKRSGSVDMLQKFRLNEKCNGYYKNDNGIDLKIASYTKKMIVSENQIYLEYDYYLENDLQSSNKLKIIF
jgi:uncharacterized beta-barrel protein YwiB (DUF1934 family)